jgi:uncharacterized protein YbbC (DUF1343 family)
VYPALGLIETTNVSVGRGTSAPFSFFGAPWMNAADVAAALTARKIPGVAFTAATKTIAEDANRYPFHGQTIPAIQIAVLDRTVFNSPETGVEILAALHRLYPAQFQLEKAMRLVANQSTLEALKRGDDARSISASWNGAIESFRTKSAASLLYP